MVARHLTHIWQDLRDTWCSSWATFAQCPTTMDKHTHMALKCYESVKHMHRFGTLAFNYAHVGVIGGKL